MSEALEGAQKGGAGPNTALAPPAVLEKAAEQPFRLADRLALRPREAALALGMGERTLRALLPELPHVRAGGVVLIPVDGLRRWLEDQTKQSEQTVAAVAREILTNCTE